MATTNGTVYFDGTAPVPADAGSAGQFFKSNGAGSPPAMSALSGPITGVIDASSAASGVVGEVISTSLASGSAVTLTTATVVDVANVALTAGDWEIYGSIAFSGGAVTGTSSQGFIGTASGNNTTGRDLAKNTVVTPLTASAVSDVIIALPTYRVNISGTTSYYLKAQSTFTVGTATAYGTIEARRMR